MGSEPVTEKEVAALFKTHKVSGEVRDVLNRLIKERDDLQASFEDERNEKEEAEGALAAADSEAFDVLRAVRDWFHAVMFLKEPMRDPRKMCRQVERALDGI